jgi:hypothetical protein
MGNLELSAWAPYLKNPLVLVGFAFMLGTIIIYTLLRSKLLFSPTRASERLILYIFVSAFIIEIIVVISGFGLAFKQASQEGQSSANPITQETIGSQSPAVVTQGKDAPVNIEYDNATNIEKTKRSEKQPARKVKESAPEPPQGGIQR